MRPGARRIMSTRGALGEFYSERRLTELVDWRFTLAILLAAGSVYLLKSYPDASYADFAVPLLAYAAIALGFALSTSLNALSGHSPEFAEFLVSIGSRGESVENSAAVSRVNAFSALVVAYLTTAVSHWVLVVLLVGGFASYGPHSTVGEFNTLGWVGAFALSFATAFGLLQFLRAIGYISLVTNVLSAHIAKRGE